MRWIGSGGTSAMLGMTSGMTPSAAYLARIVSTRSDGGSAGNGRPGSSMMLISALRSLPLITIWLTPPSPGIVSTLVAMPSISDSVRPFKATVSVTRINGTPPPPPLTRNKVRSGERCGRSMVISKPLCELPEPSSTFTRDTACTISAGAGSGTGPMYKPSCSPLDAIAISPRPVAPAPRCARRACR